MKNAIRAFGIGLFLAGAITYFWPAQQEQGKDQAQVHANYQQQIEQLKDELAEAKHAQVYEEPKKTPEQQEQKSSAQQVSPNKGTIYIYEAISLYDIGKQAEDLGIVKVGRELELFLSKPEYARVIQKGQFELTSEMTFEEIARILTGSKK